MAVTEEAIILFKQLADQHRDKLDTSSLNGLQSSIELLAYCCEECRRGNFKSASEGDVVEIIRSCNPRPRETLRSEAKALRALGYGEAADRLQALARKAPK